MPITSLSIRLLLTLLLASLCLSAAAAQKPDTTLRIFSKPYQKWLDEDVRWIITDQERTDFNQLTTDKQRDQFVVATTARLISRRNVDAVVAYLCHLYAPHYKRSGVFDTSLTCHQFLMLKLFVRCTMHPSIVGTQG